MSKIVNRTLDFFEMFASQKKPLSLTQMMKILDIPMSSCFDVVQALEERGYIFKLSDRGNYYPTNRLFEISSSISNFDPIFHKFDAALKSICNEFKVSTWIGKVQDLDVIYLLVNNSDHPLSYTVKVGDKSRSLYATSSGKAVLGILPESKRVELVSEINFSALTPNTILSKAKLLKDIKNSLTRGWYLNKEESVEDATAISLSFKWNDVDFILTCAGGVKHMERILPKLLERCKKSIDKFLE